MNTGLRLLSATLIVFFWSESSISQPNWVPTYEVPGVSVAYYDANSLRYDQGLVWLKSWVKYDHVMMLRTFQYDEFVALHHFSCDRGQNYDFVDMMTYSLNGQNVETTYSVAPKRFPSGDILDKIRDVACKGVGH